MKYFVRLRTPLGYDAPSRLTLLLCVVIISALCLLAVGCPQPVVTPPDKPDIVYSIGFDRDSCIVYVPADDFAQPADLSITVRNTGNQSLDGLAAFLNGVDSPLFGLSKDSLESLDPGASDTLAVSFPDTDPGGAVDYAADLLIGGRVEHGVAAGKITINCRVYEFEDIAAPSTLTFTPGAPQLGEGSCSALSDDSDAQGKWISLNPDVATVDAASGKLTLHSDGEAVIGWVLRESPLKVRGKKITVYPEAGILDPVYSGRNETLYGRQNQKAYPRNLADIELAGSGGNIHFSLSGGWDVVYPAVGQSTGELRFAGYPGTSAPVTVDLLITKTVPEGRLVTHRGTAAFTVGIPKL